jgi:hypothetical protein
MAMASNRSSSRRRPRLSKAEIKAYESRRAAERRRLALRQQEEAEQAVSQDSTAYSITRDDEYGVIKSDLVRLGWIVLVLVISLAVATLILS